MSSFYFRATIRRKEKLTSKCETSIRAGGVKGGMCVVGWEQQFQDVQCCKECINLPVLLPIFLPGLVRTLTSVSAHVPADKKWRIRESWKASNILIKQTIYPIRREQFLWSEEQRVTPGVYQYHVILPLIQIIGPNNRPAEPVSLF